MKEYLPHPNAYMGFTSTESLGLVMTGGEYPVTDLAFTTMDGRSFNTTIVPPLPKENYYHCLATTPDGVLYSIGGDNDPQSVYELRPGTSEVRLREFSTHSRLSMLVPSHSPPCK